MKRVEFLKELQARLWALPEGDIQCSLDYSGFIGHYIIFDIVLFNQNAKKI